ncbi:FG-GAP-like repeat-containing protein [Streptomyces sp. VNUA116]|uniref:FG-GAP-like repeat-containing protein n=1 Tax=Streptomyces sp. VNUA116 TaxID=3062449 RepID=UPI00267637C8|nr:FG-GAP-like repeat-containing protein [Streptomyces sp. VNUA116]WKU47542.1 FG-GAP-like repeat-containing protein [Streptomyces sp. VNUA116]
MPLTHPRPRSAARLFATTLAAALTTSLAVTAAAPAAAAPSPHAAAVTAPAGRQNWKVPRLAVMPLGDSITWGAGSSAKDGYRAVLRDKLASHADSLQFVGSLRQNGAEHEGHSGWQISGLSENIGHWLPAANPNVVLLNIGTNDMDLDNDVDGAPARLGRLIDQITRAAPDMTLLVSSLVPSQSAEVQRRVEKFNAEVPRLVAERRSKGFKVGFVDMSAVTTRDLNDRLHPNDTGYAKMANAFYEGLSRAAGDGWVRERVDIKPATPRETPLGDYQVDISGDGKADYLVVDDNGAVQAYVNKGGDGHGSWTNKGVIAKGTGAPGSQVRFADIDGDGKADYLVVEDNGSVHAWTNNGGDTKDDWTDRGIIATGAGAPGNKVRFADINGDGKADYLVVEDNGSVHAWTNNGGDGHGRWNDQGRIATGTGAPRAKVRFADINGDRKADYLVVEDNGSVHAWTNNGGDGHGDWTNQGQIVSRTAEAGDSVRFADIDGDGRADHLIVHDNGAVDALLNPGGDGHGGWTDYGRIATGAGPGYQVRI